MADVKLPSTLSEAAISSLPQSAYYIPNFISQAEEELLLHKINTSPLPTWRHLSHRRLQTYPSPLTPRNTLLAAPLPTWLADPIVSRLTTLPISSSHGNTHIFSDSPHKTPNHVLVNEYIPGQGIFPHEDGDAYHPVVATISLGSSIVLDIYAKKPDGTASREDEPQWRILQEPKSLLITAERLYKDKLHGIAETEIDGGLSRESVCNWDMLGEKASFEEGAKRRETRVSLTFRDVIEVKNLGKGFEFLKRKAA